MAKPRSKKTTANPAITGLLNALKFCEPASKELGQPNQTHIVLQNHWAIAFDGVVAMGMKIDTDIVANPHTRTLVKSLEKCDAKDTTQITQLGDGRLSVKSGRFQTFVPCLPIENFNPVMPDPPCAQITPAVVNSMRIVSPIAQENAQQIMLASILLRSGSAIATDGAVIMESWHGVDLPPVVVPKSFVSIIAKIEKPAVAFGFSQHSATFYFDDGSWIRSQLYSEKWPDVDRVLNMPGNLWPVPAGFFEGLEKIADLEADHGKVWFGPKHVRTEETIENGAIYEIEGSLPDGLCFNMENLQFMQGHSTTCDFQAGDKKLMAMFYGPNFRGMVMQIVNRSKVVGTEHEPPPQQYQPEPPPPTTPTYHQPPAEQNTAWAQVSSYLHPNKTNPYADDEIPF